MKRIALLIFLLMLSACVCAAENRAVNFTEGAVVIGDSGDIVIPYGQWDALKSLGGGFYAAGLTEEGAVKYALMSESGGLVTDHLYSDIRGVGGGYVCASGNELRIFNASGEIIGGVYSAVAAAPGGYLAIRSSVLDNVSDGVLFIDEAGAETALSVSSSNGLGAFSEGYMALCDGGTSLYGYIGEGLTWALSPAYAYAGDFENGLAIVALGDGYGMINTNGEWIVDSGCEYAQRSGEYSLFLRGDVAEIYVNAEKLLEIGIFGSSAYLTGDCLVMEDADATRVYDLSGDMLFELPSGSSVEMRAGRFIIREGGWQDALVYLASYSGVRVSRMYHSIRYLTGESEGARFACGEYRDGEMRYGILGGDGGEIAVPVYTTLARAGDALLIAEDASGIKLIDTSGSDVVYIVRVNN